MSAGTTDSSLTRVDVRVSGMTQQNGGLELRISEVRIL